MKESWLQKTQKAYDHKLEKRKKKLKKEIEDLEANYREYPWDRYQKAIHNRQFELDEISASYNFDKANNVVRDLQDENKHLREVLAKVNVLAYNIKYSDSKSEGNIKKLQLLIGNYACVVDDFEFIERAKQGVW